MNLLKPLLFSRPTRSPRYKSPPANDWKVPTPGLSRQQITVARIALLLGTMGVLAADPVASISSYTAPGVSRPEGITVGPDGALWFTCWENKSIGRITTSGAISIFTDPSIDRPQQITAGPDGALWFTSWENNRIGRITTSGVISTFSDSSISFPFGITAGPDGALWFINAGNNSVGRITTDGIVTNYVDPGIQEPYSIVVGADGALWFSATRYGHSIGRITTDGAISLFTDPSISGPFAITAGSDGALWFTNDDNNSIGRITTDGVVSSYTGPGISVQLGITTGSDGALWFTNHDPNSIARITTDGSLSSYTDPNINGPYSITAGPDGAIWFSNFDGNSIGRLFVDTTPPTLSELPGPTTIPCPATPDFATPTVTDASEPVTLAYADVVTPGSCASAYSVTRTWTATDAYSNTSTASQTITVEDTTPPTISAPNITVPCSVDLLVPVTFSATASDNCDVNPIITYSPASGSSFPVGNTTVTVTATDACGNRSSKFFTVTRAALDFEGFLPPIGGADATGGTPTDSIRTFKLKSTIPFKFNAACNGSPVTTGIHTLTLQKIAAGIDVGDPVTPLPTDAATTGNQFRFTDGQWQFNLNTKSLTQGLWRATATLSDGSIHVVYLSLKN